ncbi:Sir2 family NAD+-dependent deacetylase [Celerinatantimonas diazotrophica]|uniref:Sir2 family NAD+-dependent deacetylase n=1 Tax=Celerinatantimonas diazotrophica TaxID=412034 RepID=UPI0010436395|nr:Sir2 family NAD+-dependent deacetylase [Celerinatantimonas diazotrophica]
MVKVVVLTGAGISAESGIQTFRGDTGLWADHRVEDICTPEGYQRDPVQVQAFYNQRRQELLDPKIKPNAAHIALAELSERPGIEVTLVTQNIDNLHERAGSQNIYHMHGELMKVRCVKTGKLYPCDHDIAVDEPCHCCTPASPLRPHVVWFGEMPLYMDDIMAHISQADLFIAIGTSGVVYPAAGFVRQASLSGAKTVELNLAPSQVESAFDEKYYGPATKIVPEFCHQIMG